MFKRLGSGKWCAGEASEYGVYRPFQEKIKKSKLSVRHTGTVDPEAERLCVFKPPPGLQRREQQGRATALCLFNSKSEGAAVRSVEKELAGWEKWEGGQSGGGGGGGVVGGFEDPSCRRRRGSSWGIVVWWHRRGGEGWVLCKSHVGLCFSPYGSMSRGVFVQAVWGRILKTHPRSLYFVISNVERLLFSATILLDR